MPHHIDSGSWAVDPGGEGRHPVAQPGNYPRLIEGDPPLHLQVVYDVINATCIHIPCIFSSCQSYGITFSNLLSYMYQIFGNIHSAYPVTEALETELGEVAEVFHHCLILPSTLIL